MFPGLWSSSFMKEVTYDAQRLKTLYSPVPVSTLWEPQLFVCSGCDFLFAGSGLSLFPSAAFVI